MQKLVLLSIMVLIGLFIIAEPLMAAGLEEDTLTEATLVPIVPFFLNMGGELSWDPEKQEISITRNDKQVVLKLGSCEAVIQGAARTLKNSVQFLAGQVYAPVEIIGIFADKLTLTSNQIISVFSY